MTNQQRPPQPGDSKARTQAVQTLLRDAFAATPAATSANFRTNVWARINTRKNPAIWAQWLRKHLTGITAVTAACALIAAIGGGWLAYAQNRSQRQHQIMLYLSSIDAHQRLVTEVDAQPPTLAQ